MIKYEYPYVHVVPVVNRKYPKDKVTVLEDTVAAPFSVLGKARLYTDSEFAAVYSKNGGKWTVTIKNLIEHESAARNEIRISPHNHDGSFDEPYYEGFRRGVIFALQTQFPINWPTVDMAILRVKDGKNYYLLGKKPGEMKWRFPGGFKDRSDATLEMSALREAGEEVLKVGVDPVDAFTFPRYICSLNVNDWRYRDEVDGIVTTFFHLQFIGSDDQIKAGDDLAEVQWFDFGTLNRTMMEGEHAKLYEILAEFEAKGTT